MRINLPTWLTLFRVGLLPVMVAVFYLPFPGHNITAAIVFVLAAFTDWLDGYLARRMNLTSAFGAFLDPVADKLMVAVTLFLLVESHPSGGWSGVLMAVTAAVIVGREISVSALREWMAEIGARGRIKVSVWGKYKTIMQIVGLSFLLYRQNLFDLPIYKMGLVLTGIAVVLTLWSMFLYLKLAWPELRGSAQL